ncbi:sodium:proton antiporter [Sphingobacteriales bacterium UPWRP_1]|nr:sodium:proton antiporter [Sphingobacteriales bacterium TSM_CSS]PSJ74540.1 sodium:proton antiporter [Sphingobacteriales bacterium UPWRP_1]
MEALIIIIFIIGYLAITLEHPLRIDKAVSAILLGVVCWSVFALFSENHHHTEEQLTELLPEIMNILFFLLGAMTIVELIDIHEGFGVITNFITTGNKRKLLFTTSILAFFLSAVLDNLTTAIVMASLLRKLIANKEDRLVFASMIVIAANAGGAWSPIGDVTTTMLWIGNRISAFNIIEDLFFPSLICLIVPLFFQMFLLKGSYEAREIKTTFKTIDFERNLILWLGIGCLVFVPIFKTITHLPPFMGMFLGVGIMWLATELLHRGKHHDEKHQFSTIHALSRIDSASILFFFGILAAVGCLGAIGVLEHAAIFLSNTVGNLDLIIFLIGILSSVVDNVPLVAAVMKMYSLEQFSTDHTIWIFLAYCAGTGGSMLIIGSAAGVAIMGIEKIEFFWYVRKISFLAFIGYVAGALTYLGILALQGSI